MSYPVYTVPAGDVLPILFDTFDGGTGASITMSGLAVTDIEIYKDGGVTQRASDAGYTLLDTDGIDFDGLTGIHGFSIDTGDNTDAGFYTVGAWFHVVVSAITVDAQTVSFIAAAFRIVAAEGVAGVPDVNATHWNDTAVTTPPAVNATQISGDSTAADNLEALLDGTLTGPYAAFGILESGTAQSATATTLVGRAAGAVADDAFNGCVLLVLGSTQGYWQAATITDTTLSNDTFTVGAWPGATPSGTITYVIVGVPNSSTSPIAANLTQISGAAVNTSSAQLGVNVVNAAGTAWGSGAITAASIASDAITAAKIATDAITAGKIAADAIGASELAADAATEIATAVFARAFSAAYGSYTFDEMVKLMAAVLIGKASGLAGTTATFRNLADTADVVVATVDADGNRTAVTKTP